jgi:hypothetical protein
MSVEEQRRTWGPPQEGPVLVEFMRAVTNQHHDLAMFDALTRDGTILRVGMTQTALRTLYLLGRKLIHGPTLPKAS